MNNKIRTFFRNFSHVLIFIAIVAVMIGLVELYQFLVENVWH